MKIQISPEYKPGMDVERYLVELTKYLKPGNIGDTALLGGDYPLTAANDTWEETGMELEVTSQGCYQLYGHINADLRTTGGTYGRIVVAVEDGDGFVANSERFIGQTDGTGGVKRRTGGFVFPYITTTATKQTLKLLVKTVTDGAWNTRTLKCDDDGRSSFCVSFYGRLEDR